jgi:hypothetical protein
MTEPHTATTTRRATQEPPSKGKISYRYAFWNHTLLSRALRDYLVPSFRKCLPKHGHSSRRLSWYKLSTTEQTSSMVTGILFALSVDDSWITSSQCQCKWPVMATCVIVRHIKDKFGKLLPIRQPCGSYHWSNSVLTTTLTWRRKNPQSRLISSTKMTLTLQASSFWKIHAIIRPLISEEDVRQRMYNKRGSTLSPFWLMVTHHLLPTLIRVSVPMGLPIIICSIDFAILVQYVRKCLLSVPTLPQNGTKPGKMDRRIHKTSEFRRFNRKESSDYRPSVEEPFKHMCMQPVMWHPGTNIGRSEDLASNTFARLMIS